MTAADARAWTATLVAGGAVAGVVWGLLETLRRAVVQVDREVDAVWLAGQHVAANTQTSHLLAGTREQGAALLEALPDGDRASMEGPSA